MNMLFNVGSNEGGCEPATDNIAEKSVNLYNYTDKDLTYLFKTLRIPYSKTKASILNHFEKVYDVIQYLNFDFENDSDDSESENETESESIENSEVMI